MASYQYLLDEHVFQSSPTWSGGCNMVHQATVAGVPVQVSILTHLVGWVQRFRLRGHTCGQDQVSILTHLVGWVQRFRLRGHTCGQDQVSILTHLVGWVQQATS